MAPPFVPAGLTGSPARPAEVQDPGPVSAATHPVSPGDVEAVTGGRAFPRTLVVTSHLPPSRGGVQSFTDQLVRRLPSDSVVVFAPEEPGSEAFDRAFPSEVVRYPGRIIRSPRFVPRMLAVARRHRAEAAWITSAMPLGLAAIPLRRAGIGSIVVSTHGMEIGWASVPVTAAIMRGVTHNIDTMTYLGDYMKERLAPGMRRDITQVQLTGGVDSVRFHPYAERDALRREVGLGDDPVVVIASRLVPRKGHDVLLEAWPLVQARHLRARLLVIGDGRRRKDLEQRAHEAGLDEWVHFVGTVSDEDLPAYLSAGDVFALPCRDVWRGLQVEGLGLSILEASAAGLPVVVGRSGGSPDAVQDGVTGLLVDGRSPAEVADAVIRLFDDPVAAAEMGRAGREWAVRRWSWDELALDLAAALSGVARPAHVR